MFKFKPNFLCIAGDIPQSLRQPRQDIKTFLRAFGLCFQGRIFDCINLFIFSQFYCWRNMKMRRLTYAALKCRRRRRLGRCSFITFFVACHIFQRVLIHPLQGDARRRFRLFFHDGDNRLTDEPTSRGNRSSETHIRQREVSLLRNITPPDNFWLSPTMTEFITIIEPLSFYIPPPPVCVYMCIHLFAAEPPSQYANGPLKKKEKEKKFEKIYCAFFRV